MTPPAAAAAGTAAPAISPRRRRPLAPARPAPARRPRRVSGPAARPRVVAPSPTRARGSAAAQNRTRTLLGHPLLDRLIGGRAWIGLVAFALIGIVTMQLGLLKLNAGIGRALEHETSLQRENSALSVENSEIEAGDTVELQAAHMGMQLIPAGALRFLSAGDPGAQVDRAAAVLRARASAATSTNTNSATGEASTGTNAATGETPASASTSSSAGESGEAQAATSASESSSSAASSTESSSEQASGPAPEASAEQAPQAAPETAPATGAAAGSAGGTEGSSGAEEQSPTNPRG